MTDYIKLRSTGVYTVLEAAAQRGDTAPGFRVIKHADDKDRGYGVNANPRESDKYHFEPNDQTLVPAENR
jgi:hypothetical protein